MKAGSTVLAVLVLGLATLACQPPAQQAGPLSEEDVAAIRASTDAYVQAVLAGDAAAFAGLYSEDAVLMLEFAPAVEGRAAIQAWFEGPGTVSQFTLTPVQIDGRGDLAFVRGTFSMTMTPAGALEPIQITGKYVEFKRKQADGSCARLMAESDPWIRVGRGYEECLAACQPHPDTLLFVARDGTCRQTESVV